MTMTPSLSSMTRFIYYYTLLVVFIVCPSFIRSDATIGDDDNSRQTSFPSSSSTLSAKDHGRMTIQNMTCDFFSQPLNHFVPRGRSPSYQQRYCVYDGFKVDETSPILFYTGNESPLEQYINQTGLMWELAPTLKARVVFAEHRYEGQSLPTVSEQCMSYASTIQALADYAKLVEEQLNPHQTAPVFAFGGSYGGMLAGWMRMKYPQLIQGAVAASAPIGAFPQHANTKIDSSARVLMHGMQQPYPPPQASQTNTLSSSSSSSLSSATTSTSRRRRSIAIATQDEKDINDDEDDGDNHCATNLLAAWPLITWLAKQQQQQQQENDDDKARRLLQTSFSLCQPLADDGNALPLLRWAQSVWFDLAEGSFPYPSSYIPFALLHKRVNLPAWPLQAACWKTSQLHADWGVRMTTKDPTKNVSYLIDYGDSGITLNVDWDEVTLMSVDHHDNPAAATTAAATASKDVVGLLTSVRDAVSIWYNITKDVPCYNISEAAPNRQSFFQRLDSRPWLQTGAMETTSPSSSTSLPVEAKLDPARVCHDQMKKVGSWEPLCCNDEMNLVITEAQGLGRDFFWPPSHPRNIKTYQDAIRNVTPGSCPDPDDIFGYSKEPYELMSSWLDTYYGGVKMDGHSNIIFSNGLLDPWSAGGVYSEDPWTSKGKTFPFVEQYRHGAVVQNVTDRDVIALVIPFGGHHTDLMYSSAQDPHCVTEARQIERTYIAKWIRDWRARQR